MKLLVGSTPFQCKVLMVHLLLIQTLPHHMKRFHVFPARRKINHSARKKIIVLATQAKLR